jgi:hypothetical protein
MCSGENPDTTGIDHAPLEVITTPTNYLEIIGDNTSGVWNTKAFRIEVTNQAGMYNQYVAHGRMRNMQIMVKVADGSSYYCYRWSTANNDTTNGNPAFLLKNCIARKDPRSTSGTVIGCGNSQCGDGSKNGPLYVINVLSMDCDATAGQFNTDASAWVNANVFYWNCTAVRGLYGFEDCANVVNSLAAYNLNGDFVTTTNHNYNASSDGTAAGANSRTSQTFSFRNPGNNDYHLLTTDGGAKGFGLTDPSGTGVYDDDIDSITRTGSWDIGVDQTAAATIALTGTAAASINEADIVAGGKTIILTATHEAFVPDTVYPNVYVGATKGTTAANSDGGSRSGDGAVSITFPATYPYKLKGDFAVILLYSDQGSGSVPTDWAEVTGSPFGAGTEKIQVFYKVLAGGDSDPSTTISGSAANMSVCAQMMIFQGCKIGAIGSPSNGTGSPMTASAINTTADNSIVLFLCGRGDNESSSGQTFGGSTTGVVEILDGGTDAGNDSQVSCAYKKFPTSGTTSGAGASTTSATDPWVGVMVELIPTTLFTDSRTSIRSGLDSAQAEAAGWDATVKPNIPLANIVRTGPQIVTVTLQAQADYNITATETITAILPSGSVNGGSPVTASPTFTITASGGGGNTTNFFQFF